MRPLFLLGGRDREQQQQQPQQHEYAEGDIFEGLEDELPECMPGFEWAPGPIMGEHHLVRVRPGESTGIADDVPGFAEDNDPSAPLGDDPVELPCGSQETTRDTENPCQSDTDNDMPPMVPFTPEDSINYWTHQQASLVRDVDLDVSVAIAKAAARDLHGGSGGITRVADRARLDRTCC